MGQRSSLRNRNEKNNNFGSLKKLNGRLNKLFYKKEAKETDKRTLSKSKDGKTTAGFKEKVKEPLSTGERTARL